MLSLTDPPVEEAKSGEAEASEEECSTAGTEQSYANEVNNSTSIDVLDELRATLRKSGKSAIQAGGTHATRTRAKNFAHELH